MLPLQPFFDLQDELGGGGGGAAAGRSGAAAARNPSPGEAPQGRRSSGDGAEGASCSHRLRFSSLSLSLVRRWSRGRSDRARETGCERGIRGDLEEEGWKTVVRRALF